MDTASQSILDRVRESIPDYARDLRLNLGSVLQPGGAPGLSERQIWAVAVASAIASRNYAFTQQLEAAATPLLDAAHLNAARSAAAIMGMNNIYYRFLHLVGDPEYQALPARLRMNVIGSPGIDKMDFELLSLAVSAINGCGQCVSAHEKQLRQHGIGREAIQSAVRIAAIVHAVAAVLGYSSAAQAAAAGPQAADSQAA